MVADVKFKLSNNQFSKLKNAVKKQEGITLRLRSSMIDPRGFPIELTDNEVNLLNDNQNHNIELSYSRIKNMDGKVGGILPLIPIIIAALTAAGMAGGTAASIASTVKKAKDIENEKRKTEAQLENERRKTEAYIESTKRRGEGLFLRAGRGRGLFLRAGRGKKSKKAILEDINGEGMFLRAGRGLYLGSENRPCSVGK